MKIWLLTNGRTPYQAELFDRIVEMPEVALQIRYMRGGREPGGALEVARERSSTRVIKPGQSPSFRDVVRQHGNAVWECICGHHDCYVLSGSWTSVLFIACLVVLWLRRRPRVLWLERPHSDKVNVSKWITGSLSSPFAWISGRVRKLLLGLSDAVLCIGTSSREAYAKLGVPDGKLFIVPYCCDTSRFQSVPSEHCCAVRARYSLDGNTVLLFSGQMIQRKGVDTLIKVFERVAKQRADVALLLLGDGVQKSKYEGMVPNELRTRVHFAGFVTQTDLPAHFAAADVFVFPSRHDGWGVVINEACAAGLPVVASEQTGAAHDLVENGRSGFVLDAEDIDGFADRLLRLIDDPALRGTCGKQSRELVAPFSAANGAALFIRHLRDVLGCEKKEHGRAADLTRVQ